MWALKMSNIVHCWWCFHRQGDEMSWWWWSWWWWWSFYVVWFYSHLFHFSLWREKTTRSHPNNPLLIHHQQDLKPVAAVINPLRSKNGHVTHLQSLTLQRLGRKPCHHPCHLLSNLTNSQRILMWNQRLPGEETRRTQPQGEKNFFVSLKLSKTL